MFISHVAVEYVSKTLLSSLSFEGVKIKLAMSLSLLLRPDCWLEVDGARAADADAGCEFIIICCVTVAD